MFNSVVPIQGLREPGLTHPTPGNDPEHVGATNRLPEGLLEVFSREFLTRASHGFNVTM